MLPAPEVSVLFPFNTPAPSSSGVFQQVLPTSVSSSTEHPAQEVVAADQ
jgi:hypothetical protein